MSGQLTGNKPRVLLTDFLTTAREWLFAHFVASTHCFHVAHVIAQPIQATLISTSYQAHNRSGEQIKVTADAF
jgi:hypothetical protein